MVKPFESHPGWFASYRPAIAIPAFSTIGKCPNTKTSGGPCLVSEIWVDKLTMIIYCKDPRGLHNSLAAFHYAHAIGWLFAIPQIF